MKLPLGRVLLPVALFFLIFLSESELMRGRSWSRDVIRVEFTQGVFTYASARALVTGYD
jgi:hypothetical protein